MRSSSSRSQGRPKIENDCNSEGDDPPVAEYIDPNTIDDSHLAPPRNNQPVVLPFFQSRERRRFRENYESKISFEDWVEDAEEAGNRTRKVGVAKLDDDSDFPVGRPYFFRAYCCHPDCTREYYPHIPGQWTCLKCKSKVWQQPEDPQSKNCARCKRAVARMVTVGGHKIRNPMALNSHVCKRCGRIVCDNCYSPKAVPLPELGYTEDQHICTTCVADLAEIKAAPAEEDLGTLYEEQVVGDAIERNLATRYWVPKCTQCNITFGEPPPRWNCTNCNQQVWQPLEAVDSASCWLCGNLHPKARCHDCGQLVCYLCGAYAQPLPHRGFLNLNAVSVCKGCYRGVSVTKKGETPFAQPTFKPVCSQCKQALGNIPDMWLSRCHKAKAWQVECTKCAVCAVPLAAASGDNCRRCGRLVCQLCAQFKEPVTDRGYPKERPETVCRECFNPAAVLESTPFDFETWPPSCEKCNTRFAKPPSRWRCPNQCGTVWQGPDHVASRSCWCCGKKLGGGVVNCRKCGRLVCATCGEGRSEIPELGFTRGIQYPTCKTCLQGAQPVLESREESPAATASAQPSAVTASQTPTLGGTGISPRGATPATARSTPAPTKPATPQPSARATPSQGRATPAKP